MKKETTNTATEETRGYAKETDKQKSNSQLLETKIIPETPFIARRYDEKWIVTVGKYKIREGLSSYEECEAAAKDVSWETITTVIQAIVEENMNGNMAKIIEQHIEKYPENRKS